MSLNGAGKQHLVLPSVSADAVNEMIDLVDQRVEQGLHFDGEMRQHLPETGFGGTATFDRKGVDTLFTTFAAGMRGARLVFNGLSERSDLIGVATEEVGLLLFEKGEQGAIFLQLIAQAFGNKFPGYIHGGLRD